MYNCAYWRYYFHSLTEDNDIQNVSTTENIPNAHSGDKLIKKSAFGYSIPFEDSLNCFVADQGPYMLSDIEDTRNTKTLILVKLPWYFKWLLFAVYWWWQSQQYHESVPIPDAYSNLKFPRPIYKLRSREASCNRWGHFTRCSHPNTTSKIALG